MQRLFKLINKFAVIVLLAAVLVSVVATTPTVGATTHPIQYHIGCPPSIVDDGSLDYFKAHGFTAVHLIVPDTGTYQTELNKIKSLGMQPIIDVEFVIWSDNSGMPISNFASYFQKLKDAGWEYVSSESGRAGDLDFMSKYFKGYINYNCDQCGLWMDMYKHNFTITNSWESYYTSEWPYIQKGALEAASLGKQNGILAGVWEYGSDGVDNNPILTNSKNGGSPSYKSMLDWSYANGIGFNHFHVWWGSDSQGLDTYKALGFEKIVADLQVYYPATSSSKPSLNQTTTTLSASTTTPTVGQSVTFTATLKNGTIPLSDKSVTIYHNLNGVVYTDAKNTTNAAGQITFMQTFGSIGQQTYYATFADDGTYRSSTSNVVTINVRGSSQTTTTLTASNSTPVVGQTVTFTVNLKSGSAGLSKSVKIWHTTDGVRWEDGTFNTVNGVYTFTQSFGTTGQRIYHAEFAGDNTYASSSGTSTVNVGTAPTTATTTTITASNPNPTVGSAVTLSVTVKAGSTVLLNKQVTVTHTYPGSTTPGNDGVFNTGSTGTATFSATYGSAGQRVYTAAFAGDSTYGASSGTVTVNVGTTKIATTTTITASPTNPTVGSGITLTVTVKAGTTVLLNKNVTVTHTYPGSTTPGNDGVFNTGSTGTKTFSSGTYSTAGPRVYTAAFAGDSTYGASSGTVTVNVGTTTTITP